MSTISISPNDISSSGFTILSEHSLHLVATLHFMQESTLPRIWPLSVYQIEWYLLIPSKGTACFSVSCLDGRLNGGTSSTMKFSNFLVVSLIELLIIPIISATVWTPIFQSQGLLA